MPKRAGVRQTDDAVVTVRLSDLKHILDVWIDNGMTEAEDVEIIERLWEACSPIEWEDE